MYIYGLYLHALHNLPTSKLHNLPTSKVYHQLCFKHKDYNKFWEIKIIKNWFHIWRSIIDKECWRSTWGGSRLEVFLRRIHCFRHYIGFCNNLTNVEPHLKRHGEKASNINKFYLCVFKKLQPFKWQQ